MNTGPGRQHWSLSNVTGESQVKKTLPQGKMASLNLPQALFPWIKWKVTREKCVLTGTLHADSKAYVTWNHLADATALGFQEGKVTS